MDLCNVEAAGFTGCLTKPVHPSELMDLLAMAWATRSSDPPRLITRQLHRERAMPDPAAEGAPWKGARVLVVEDNTVNQKVAMRMLMALQCRVDVAATGAEAVALTDSISYDLVLMDVQMPEMDGYDATAEIRRREASCGSHLSIVAMTARAMTGDRERCLVAGMDGYLSKPVKREELVEVLGKFLTQTVPAAESNTPSLDLSRLHEISTDDGEFEQQLIGAYLEDGAQQIEHMYAALEQEDWARMEGAVHTLKGTSGSMGVLHLQQLLEALETLDDPDGIVTAVTEIRDEFARARVLLRGELARLR
jgi:two-component system sensor histidine kinase/response regulator